MCRCPACSALDPRGEIRFGSPTPALSNREATWNIFLAPRVWKQSTAIRLLPEMSSPRSPQRADLHRAPAESASCFSRSAGSSQTSAADKPECPDSAYCMKRLNKTHREALLCPTPFANLVFPRREFCCAAASSIFRIVPRAKPAEPLSCTLSPCCFASGSRERHLGEARCSPPGIPSRSLPPSSASSRAPACRWPALRRTNKTASTLKIFPTTSSSSPLREERPGFLPAPARPDRTFYARTSLQSLASRASGGSWTPGDALRHKRPTRRRSRTDPRSCFSNLRSSLGSSRLGGDFPDSKSLAQARLNNSKHGARMYQNEVIANRNQSTRAQT